MSKLINETFNNITSIEVIGQSYLGKDILAYKFGSNPLNNAILFTGLHHAREPASLSMCIYLILYLIKLNLNNSAELNSILQSTNIYFIPIINVDGYIANNNIFKNTLNIEEAMIRKNRHFEDRKKSCFSVSDKGVDINRNYDFKFALNEDGSNSDPCADDYRGNKAFSEPETRAVRDFIDKYNNIKIAFNYHAFGNIAIIPFNYELIKTKTVETNYNKQYKIYRDFIEQGHFPDHFTFGNGFTTIGYILKIF